MKLSIATFANRLCAVVMRRVTLFSFGVGCALVAQAILPPPSIARSPEGLQAPNDSSKVRSDESDLEESIRSITNRLTDDQLHGHIRFLSHDLLEGRGPDSSGDHLTQLYLETQFRVMGLKELASVPGFRQPFPMVGMLSKPDQEWTFKKGGAPVGETYRFYDDFIVSAGKPKELTKIEGAEVVFVGYGIQAPEFDWDDFKGMDFTGKIILVMNNDPEDDPELFAGARRLYYGRWSYKYEMAARIGAAGAIIIHTDHSAGYPFSVIQTSGVGEEFELSDTQSPKLDMKAWMSNAATERLVASAGYDLNELRARAESRNFSPVPLGITLSTAIECDVRERETANIVGLLPGTDPKLRDEYVVFMAHHDHLGLAPSRDERGDTIYNGAIDNASGTAALLAMAQAVRESGEQPRRSLLFVAVGAEEQGLLGSQYFAENPPVPLGKISALVNMDALNFLGRTKDVQVVGFGKSSLDQLVANAAKRQGRVVVPDREPSKGYYYRSDQFSLAKVGVPGVYLHSGYEVIGKPDGWGKNALDAWTQNDYHQRSDEYKSEWDLTGAQWDAQLLLDVGWQAANADSMQSWTPGDEFEAARIKSIEELQEPGS